MYECVGRWLQVGWMDYLYGFVGRWVLGSMCGWLCRLLLVDFLDIWTDLLVGAWWLVVCMDMFVGRLMVVGWMYGWVDASLSVWWLGWCRDRHVGRFVVVVFMCGWMYR